MIDKSNVSLHIVYKKVNLKYFEKDMYQYVLSIGSNTYAERNIKKARLLLSKAFDDISFSTICISEPFGLIYRRKFHNIIAHFTSKLSPDDIIKIAKNIEKQMGRIPSDKAKGRVIIDIDVVCKDDEVLRPDDYKRDYFQKLLVEANLIS